MKLRNLLIVALFLPACSGSFSAVTSGGQNSAAPWGEGVGVPADAGGSGTPLNPGVGGPNGGSGGTGPGGVPGAGTTGTTGSGGTSSLIKAPDGSQTVTVPIARVEVSTTVDHSSWLVIEPGRIFWRHTALGVPTSTTVSLFDASGKLINTSAWTPQFQLGRGPNCSVSLYCTNTCACDSDEIKLTQPALLRGNVTVIAGRGGVDKISTGSPTIISVRDCGSDCGRSGPKLGGAGSYQFNVD